jgi:hypothetical protein
MNTKFRNSEGKLFGTVLRDVFIKHVKKSKHLFRKLNAWGIDKDIVDSFVSNGVQIIFIHEEEENMDYTVSVKDFLEKGIEGDYGKGKQIFLPLENFRKEEGKEKV